MTSPQIFLLLMRCRRDEHSTNLVGPACDGSNWQSYQLWSWQVYRQNLQQRLLSICSRNVTCPGLRRRSRRADRNEPEAVLQMNFLVRRMNQAHQVGSTTTQCASRDEPSSSVIMQLGRPFLARQL